MRNKPTLRLCAAALGLMMTAGAHAADYRELLKDKKFAEVEQAAGAVLAKDPANAAAMIARTDAIIGAGDGRFDEAAKQAERCIAAHPDNSGCHVAFGKALGSKAIANGIMSAMSYAGSIRDAFKKAVELDPRDADARFSLHEYYMLAPFVVGGGTGKAEALAKQTAAINPEAGRLMSAVLDANEGRLEKAEAAAVAARPGADAELQERHEALLLSVGSRYMSDKKFADAARVLREAQKRYPESVDVAYIGARLNQEQGKHGEALASFESVLARMPKPYVHYRIGKSLIALGEKAKARAAFEKALSFKSGLSARMRTDAEELLKSLRG